MSTDVTADGSGRTRTGPRPPEPARRTAARAAGCTYLLYIAVGILAVVLFGRATTGAQGTAAKLAGIAQHATGVRVAVVLSLLACFAALVLAVTLYALTRDQVPDLALLALTCRVGEGVLNAAIGVPAMAGLLWLGMAAQPGERDAASAQALGTFLFKVLSWNPIIAATFFAAGSTLFSWLLLRGRMVPVPLAWLGVLASALLVVVLPLQLAGFIAGPVTLLTWLPMLAFEVTFALWLLFKGVGTPGRRQSE